MSEKAPTSRYPLKVVYSESFKRDYASVIRDNRQLRKKLGTYVDALSVGNSMPGMNLEKIQGFDSVKGLRSVRLNDDIRMSIILGEDLKLVRVGHHDELYRNPL